MENDPYDPKADQKYAPRTNLNQAEKNGGSRSDGDSGSDSESSSGGYNPANIKGREQFADKGSLFNNKKDNRSGNNRSFLKRNRSKFIMGGAAGGGIIGLIIGLFFLLIPLKIEHIVTKLEKHYFATSEKAVEDQTETMLSRYVKRYVIPALNQCRGSTVDKNCNPRIGTSDNPVRELYRGWSDARLEYKLATNHGIEFRAVKSGAHTRYFMKAPGLDPDGEDISNFVKDGDDGNLFQQVSQGRRQANKEMRQAVRSAMQDETKWKKVMYRFKVGRLLEQKYGTKRCIIFCGTRDTVQLWKDKKVNVPKMFIAQRIITPHTETMGIIMQCLLDPDCDPTKTSPQPASEGESTTLAGAPESELETTNRKKFIELAASYNITDSASIDKMIKDYEDISKGGYQKYFLNKALEKAGISALSDKVTNAIPVVGWVVSASELITKLKTLGPAVKKLSYVAGSGAAVQLYSMYRTYGDEVHTGNVDAAQVGQMVDSLGAGDQGEPGDPAVGGTASAEEAPMYNYLFDDSATGSSTALLDGVLPERAFAATASSGSSNYKCADGKPVPAGKLVCSEEEFGQGNKALNKTSEFLKGGIVAPISAAAGFVSSVAGQAAQLLPFSGFISSLVSHVPGFSDLTAVFSNLMSGVVASITPSSISTNMSGGRKFQVMTAGAAASGSDFAHTGLGGRKATAAEVGAIAYEQETEAREDFEQQPLFARLFSTDLDHSLISRVAMATPISLQSSARSGFATIITNPLSALTHGFGSLFTSRASAVATADKSYAAFGVTPYIPKVVPNADDFWDQYCSNDASKAYQSEAGIAKYGDWNQQAADNPDGDNGMPVNNTANPCLTIKGSVGSAGATSNSNLLTADDKADIGGTGDSGSDPAAPTSTASTTVDKKDLDKDSTDVGCAENTKNLGVEDGYTSGNKIKIRICAVSNLPSTGEESNNGFGVSGAGGKAVVNSRASGAVYAMVKAAKENGVTLEARSSFRTMAHQRQLCRDNAHCSSGTYDEVARPGTSNHQLGVAIDFYDLPSTPGPINNKTWEWLSKNASKYGYENYPREAWHWSPTGS